MAPGNFTQNLNGLTSPPTVTAIPNQTGTVGIPLSISAGNAFTESANLSLTFAVTGLPGSLSINPSTGVIAGTPSTTGVYPLTVSATDPQELSATTSFTLTVNEIAVVLTASSQTLTVGQSVTLTTTGCQNGTITWSSGSAFDGQTSMVVSPGITAAYSATCTVGFYQATASVSLGVLPVLSLINQVSSNRGEVGQILTYTLVVINSGNAPATNVLVRDSISSGLVMLPGSITTLGGTFSLGSPVNLWTIPSIPASSTVTLVFSASVTSDGVVYNTASIPGTIAKVCTSIPIKFCKDATFELELLAPTGYSLYQWFRRSGTGQEIKVYEGPVSSFTATEFGEYRVMATDMSGLCLDLSCCPIIIQNDSIPLVTVITRSPTCVANQPVANGQLTVMGLGNNPTSFRYAISEGSSFTVVNPTVQAIPANGLIANELAGDRAYTVRVYNATGCFRDVSTNLISNCQCGAAGTCAAIRITRIKRAL